MNPFNSFLLLPLLLYEAFDPLLRLHSLEAHIWRWHWRLLRLWRTASSSPSSHLCSPTLCNDPKRQPDGHVMNVVVCCAIGIIALALSLSSVTDVLRRRRLLCTISGSISLLFLIQVSLDLFLLHFSAPSSLLSLFALILCCSCWIDISIDSTILSLVPQLFR